MKVDFVLLAQAAQAGGGDLFIHGGGLRQARVPMLPAGVPVTIALRLEAEPGKIGDHHALGARGFRPGQDVPYFESPALDFAVAVDQEVDPLDPVISIVGVLGLGTVLVVEEGLYNFELILDGEPVARLPLRVRLVSSETVVSAEPGSGIRTVERVARADFDKSAEAPGAPPEE